MMGLNKEGRELNMSLQMKEWRYEMDYEKSFRDRKGVR